MAEDTNICCCDLTPHPEDKTTWTGPKAAGYRYQLIKESCHVEYIEVISYDSAGTETVTAKFFTSEEPDAGTPDGDADVNIWILTVGKSAGGSAWTPDAFAGKYFRNGVFLDVISADTSAKIMVNIIYYLRENYIPAIPERPYERRTRLWRCYKGDAPYGDNFSDGYAGDTYDDTANGNTVPGDMAGESENYGDSTYD